jgi:hypothetical protein
LRSLRGGGIELSLVPFVPFVPFVPLVPLAPLDDVVDVELLLGMVVFEELLLVVGVPAVEALGLVVVA